MKKLFGLKTEENETYFQLERCLDVLQIIDKIEEAAFSKNCGYEFASYFQSGLPDKESYFSIKKRGLFMAVVTTKERMHIIIHGKIDQKKIKGIVSKEFIF